MGTAVDQRLLPARADLAAEHLRGTVQAPRYASGKELLVAAPVLDMTDSPDRAAGLSNQLLMGETFIAYDQDTDTGLAWGQAAADGYVGYVSMAGLEDGPEPDYQVTALATYIYPEPSMKTRPLEMLPMMARIARAGADGDFVELRGGGYCPARHVGPIAPVSTDFVAVAERFLGRPYLWGGRSAEGVDCSGLVQLSLAATGQVIGRDADLQETAGEAVEGPPERGDLVFWRGHVGIMQSPVQLLHANAHHMAVVSEPLAEAEARIKANEYGPVTACRRLRANPAGV